MRAKSVQRERAWKKRESFFRCLCLFSFRDFVLRSRTSQSQAKAKPKLRRSSDGFLGHGPSVCVSCYSFAFGLSQRGPCFLLSPSLLLCSSSFFFSFNNKIAVHRYRLQQHTRATAPPSILSLSPSSPSSLFTSHSARAQRFDDRMSAAVRAALAAKRAEHRSRSASPTKLSPSLPNGGADNELPHFGRDLDASIASPFGSPKPAARSLRAADADRSSASPAPEMDLNQKSEEDVVRLSIQTGGYYCRHGGSICSSPPSWHGA